MRGVLAQAARFLKTTMGARAVGRGVAAARVEGVWVKLFTARTSFGVRLVYEALCHGMVLNVAESAE